MVHWHEPKSGERAGFGKFDQPMSDYDRFMESVGLPVFRGVRHPQGPGSVACRLVADGRARLLQFSARLANAPIT